MKLGRRVDPPRPEELRVVRGRGATANPTGRFESRVLATDPDAVDEPREGAPAAEWIEDRSRTAITYNDSPDLHFSASLNPYRGCSHGCAYCYARPTHEYLGYSAGLDFETKILVKRDAPALLRVELGKRSWTPTVIAISGVTDCYQPAERTLGLTRACLEVLSECRNPVSIITKNELVTRDLDLLKSLAAFEAVAVTISLPTLDAELSGRLEPRASRPPRRLAAIRALADAGVPVGVNVAPVIPGLTDHEMPRVVEAAAGEGASFAGLTMLRLPLTVAPIFSAWLDEHEPGRKDKILNRVREMRNGKLNEGSFHDRMKGKGVFAEQTKALFRAACVKHGLGKFPALSTAHFRRPSGAQLPLL